MGSIRKAFSEAGMDYDTWDDVYAVFDFRNKVIPQVNVLTRHGTRSSNENTRVRHTEPSAALPSIKGKGTSGANRHKTSVNAVVKTVMSVGKPILLRDATTAARTASSAPLRQMTTGERDSHHKTNAINVDRLKRSADDPIPTPDVISASR
jgi:hypothetical protein